VRKKKSATAEEEVKVSLDRHQTLADAAAEAFLAQMSHEL
jgi:hypothetical protein